jgi:hypothetical protein
MEKTIRYNISILLTWLIYIVLRKPFSQESYDLIKDNYKTTTREKRMMARIAKINGLSDINKVENLFADELTSDNIYRYYLEQTGDKKEAEKLLDDLIKEMGKLIEKGNK